MNWPLLKHRELKIGERAFMYDNDVVHLGSEVNLETHYGSTQIRLQAADAAPLSKKERKKLRHLLK